MILGVGNSLMQITVNITDEKLSELGFQKSTMNLVDYETIHKTLTHLKSELSYEASGDTANSMLGIAALGGKSFYIGKIGHDDLGKKYRELMQKHHVTAHLSESPTHTGTVISLITPDGERTMLTFLGAAITLTKEDIKEKFFQNQKILYLSSYIIEEPNLYEAAIYAMQLAKKYNMTIAFDAAFAGIITRNHDRIINILKEYVNILFANEDEAAALTNLPAEQSVNQLNEYVDIAVVKLGKAGSIIKTKESTTHYPITPVTPVDTTGAGDLFAAGFLHAYVQNKSLKECAELASHVAAKIVQQIGTTLR